MRNGPVGGRRGALLQVFGKSGLQLTGLLVLMTGTWMGVAWGLMEGAKRGYLDGVPTGSELSRWIVGKLRAVHEERDLDDRARASKDALDAEKRILESQQNSQSGVNVRTILGDDAGEEAPEERA